MNRLLAILVLFHFIALSYAYDDHDKVVFREEAPPKQAEPKEKEAPPTPVEPKEESPKQAEPKEGHPRTEHDHKPKWGYDPSGDLLTPEHWDEVSRYCNNDMYMQSPINIVTSKLTRDPLMCDPLNELDSYFVNGNTGHISGLVKNNGHSLVVTPVRVLPASSVSSGARYRKLNQETNCIMEISNFWNYNHHIPENQYYCFDSFHFHWGRAKDGKGSEHQMDGHQYPLEAHFVHYSCDYGNIGEALTQWRKGGHIGIDANQDLYVLGVIGVFFKIGAPNPTLGKIFKEHASLQRVNEEVLIEGLSINHLIPRNKAYYTYDGSLTTPPCFPVVRWHIMKQVLTVSEAQMEMLRALMNGEGKSEGNNYRPIESNPNPVYDCTTPVY